MSLEIGNIVKQQQASTMQGMMQEKEYKYDSDIDSLMAMYVYYFLEGKNDRMPTFSSVDKLIEKERKSTQLEAGLISTGYGVSVKFDEISRILEIECVEKIKSATYRVDKITADDYSAYVVTEGGIPKPIDVNELPRFSNDRVRKIKMYIVEHHKHMIEKSIEKNQKRV